VLHCATPSGAGSFKSQMKKADASGAAFAVILGEDEIAGNVAAVKSLRGEAGQAQQSSVPFDAVVDYVVDQIVGDDHDHDHVHYHA
jgi:histidyl-tRNA synthetase